MDHNRKAFTLIELLVGLVIFAIIGSTLYAVYANGIRLDRRSRQMEGFYREARWAMETIAREMENMVGFRYQDFYENDKGAFIGSEDSVSLLTASDEGLKVVRYRLADPESAAIHAIIIHQATQANKSLKLGDVKAELNYFLIREELPFSALYHPDSEEVQVEILSRHVREGSLKFSYAYRDEKDDEILKWQPTWDKTWHPAGVRVNIVFNDAMRLERPLEITRDILIPTGFWGKGDE